MPRKPHPTELRDAKIIGNAVRFEISLLLGVGRFANGAAATLAEAHVEAERLAAANPSSRRPLIYAIDARHPSATAFNHGRSVYREDLQQAFQCPESGPRRTRR